MLGGDVLVGAADDAHTPVGVVDGFGHDPDVAGDAVGALEAEGGGGGALVVQEGAQEAVDRVAVVGVGVLAQVFQGDRLGGGRQSVQFEQGVVPGDVAVAEVLLEASDAAQALRVLEESGDGGGAVLEPPDDQHVVAVAADADLSVGVQGHPVDHGGHAHALGTEGLTGGVDVLDLYCQAARLGREGIGLQQSCAENRVGGPAGEVHEGGVDVAYDEFERYLGTVRCQAQDQAGVEDARGQSAQGVELRVGRAGVRFVVGPGLQCRGGQLREGLDLTLQGPGLLGQRVVPADLQHADQAAAEPGRYREPAAGELVLSDGGQRSAGELGDRGGGALVEGVPGRSEDPGGHVPPALGLGRAEAGTAAQ